MTESDLGLVFLSVAFAIVGILEYFALPKEERVWSVALFIISAACFLELIIKN